MLAEAAGTLDTDAITRLLAANAHRSQTIHNPRVHGLTPISSLSAREIDEILTSDEWVRLATLRNPVSRSYSAWENRVLMRVSSHVRDIEILSPDIMVDGRIDMTASFSVFAEALRNHTDVFMRDPHFVPQSTVVQPAIIDYNMLVQVDKPDGVGQIASMLSERSSKTIVPQRHNESIGVPLRQVCSEATAAIIRQVYQSDYTTFGFTADAFEHSPEHYVLSRTETQLVTLVRQSIERITSVSRAAQAKMSARYGIVQVRKALLRKLSLGYWYSTPRGMNW